MLIGPVKIILWIAAPMTEVPAGLPPPNSDQSDESPKGKEKFKVISCDMSPKMEEDCRTLVTNAATQPENEGNPELLLKYIKVL